MGKRYIGLLLLLFSLSILDAQEDVTPCGQEPEHVIADHHSRDIADLEARLARIDELLQDLSYLDGRIHASLNTSLDSESLRRLAIERDENRIARFRLEELKRTLLF